MKSNRNKIKALCAPPWGGEGGSVHELRVPLGSGHDHVHPDAHGVGGGRHHVVEPVVGLHAEGQGGVRALRGGGTETQVCGVIDL